MHVTIKVVGDMDCISNRCYLSDGTVLNSEVVLNRILNR